MVSLDAYRHWFDLAESERRPDLLWLTASLDADSRISIKARLIECKVAQRSDQHLLNARAQITNGLRVLMPAFAPNPSGDANATEDRRPDQRYWWLQLHRLVASKTEVESSGQAEVLSALERLAEGDYTITWGASVFAFWSDDHSAVPVLAGTWPVSDVANVTASIYVMGSDFVRRLALGQPGYPKSWSEWEAFARKSGTNICDALSDVEPSTEFDEDEDVLPAVDEHEQESDEDVQIDDGAQEPELQPVVEPPVALETGEHSVQGTSREITDSADAIASKSVDTTRDVETAADAGGSVAWVAPSTVPSIPDRVLLGKTIGVGRPVYWEFGHQELPNRHMVVFGTSGMGKTYALQCVLCELARKSQSSLIIDYTDGFVDSRIEQAAKMQLRPIQHYVRKNPLPINPFLKQVSVEEGIEFPDTPNTIAKRVGAIFKSVYELGDQQFSVLIEAIKDGLELQGDAFNLEGLVTVLETFVDDGIHNKARVQGTISKLRPFIDEHPFSTGTSDDDWRAVFTDPERPCHVFQFLSVDRHTSRALIEFVLWDLYAHVRRFGNKSTPQVVVLDEVQNLDLGGDAPVAKYLTEGRKFGLSLITATQSIRGSAA
jgi:DNA phosphorothioation-dependent restriction protein DptH